MKNVYLAAFCSSLVLLNGCSSSDSDSFENLKMEVAGTYVSGNDFDTSSAEIVSYDEESDRLYVVNAEDQTVDVLQLDSDGVPTKDTTIDLSAAAKDAGIKIGDANSVVAQNGYIAAAIQNDDKQLDGIIALYKSSDFSLVNTYAAGALPDMVTMTEDGNTIIAANEGEPSADYQTDPEGSVTIVDISAGTSDSDAVVTQVNFQEFNVGGSKKLGSGVRVPRPYGATVAEDLEPEYVAITAGGKAIVALQENNAFATIDIATKTVEAIEGLGEKSWASVADGGMGYKLDVTNKDDTFTQMSVPQMVGLYMPDTIASFTIDGVDYIISANEGDGREYITDAYDNESDCESNLSEAVWDDECIAYTDEGRGKDLNVDGLHPLSEDSYGSESIENKNALGRIKVIMDDEDIAHNDNIRTFGARSFSIWNADETSLVYDSGNDLSDRANTSQYWNMTNDSNASNDNRSDDKGIEPEAVEVAQIAGATIAFVGLERHGGVAAYNISNPEEPVFLDYINNRDFSADVCTVVDDGDCDNDIYNPAAGDLGPESIEFFTRGGKGYIAVSNEVSGTTTVYKLNVSK